MKTLSFGKRSAIVALLLALPAFAQDFTSESNLRAVLEKRLEAEVLPTCAIAGFAVNTRRLAAALDRNPMLVTALNPVIGYDKAVAIAKRAYAEGRPVREVAAEMTDLGEERLAKLLDPADLTRGGVRHGAPGD